MRIINVNKIKEAVALLCVKANVELRKGIFKQLKRAALAETRPKAKNVLNVLVENARIAKKDGLPICQDTGMASVYLEIGQQATLAGGDLEGAVNAGVRLGYRRGYLRKSIVDPITRKNTGDNTPCIIHARIVSGDRLKITVVPKGFGCENKTQLKLFKPTAEMPEIKKFIVDAVKTAGPDACPPYVIGVGIGGTSEKAVEMSKEALMRRGTGKFNKLEKELFNKMNALNIGPAGLGGKTTVLEVNVLAYPTHIAGLPVAVSIGCHAMRSAAMEL